MKKDKKFIWDYDLKQMNFDDPEVLKWYLKRKIDFGHWEVIDKGILSKYLPELDIDPFLKALLTQFLKDEKNTHAHSRKVPARSSKK